MDDQKIREAIEFDKDWKEGHLRATEEIIRHRDTLFTLAQEYLACSRIVTINENMDEAKKILEEDSVELNQMIGWNAAVHACTLALMKRVSVEKI